MSKFNIRQIADCPMPDKLLTVQEAAQLLGVSTKTLRRWDKAGILVPLRTIGKQRRYQAQKVEAFKRSNKSLAKKAPYIIQKKELAYGVPPALRIEKPVKVKPRGAEIKRKKSQAVDNGDLLTVQNAAYILGVSTKTLRRWDKEKILVPLRTAGGQRRYQRQQVEALQKPSLEKSSRNQNISPVVYGLEKPIKVDRSKEKTPKLSKTQKVILFTSVCAFAMLGFITILLKTNLVIPDLIGNLDSRFRGNDKGGGNDKGLYNNKGLVLGEQSTIQGLFFNVNVPSTFKEYSEFAKGLQSLEIASLSGGLTTENQDINAGTGTLTASNVLYEVVAGTGITVTGDAQRPTITNTVELAAGSGISVSGTKISNTGALSVGGKTGDVKLSAGTGITISDVTITNSGVTSLTGTSNQVTVSGSTGGVTLSLPQSIGTSSSPAFAGLTLSDFTSNGGVIYTNASGILAQVTAGSSTQCLIGGTTPSFGSCEVGGIDAFWNQSSGALFPNNATVDLLVGGTASSSAKFAALNINSGTPTASVSAGTAGGAYLNATGTLATTAMQTLTLGSSTTGNLSFNSAGTTAMTILPSGAVGIGDTSPAALLTVGSGDLFQVNSSGQCVTGDSILVTEDGERIRVDQVKEGQKVYTLNQQTGKFVPAQINALLDMGVRPVFKLTTKSGKSIRTTGNHPYLVKSEDLLKEGYVSQKGSDQSQTKGNSGSSGGIVEINSGFHNDNSRNLNAINKDNIANKRWLVNQKKNLSFVGLGEIEGTINTAADQAAERLINQSANTVNQTKFIALTVPEESQYVNQVGGTWTKVTYLKEGMEIAVAGSSFEEMVWDEIVSIEYTGFEQVWDLSIEGTHNFVANGIVAHNTTVTPGTTGTFLDYALETEWTSGTLINADFAGATTQATSAMIGLQFDLDTNLTGANGLGITGTNIIMNALTQTSADTATYTVYGNSASGALTQNTLAGTINWRGANLTLPIITQTTGTVIADGLRVLVPASGAIVTGGTMSGVNIVAPTTSGPAAGTLYGVQIGALTSAGGATETAMSIGSGWDTDINATTSLEIGIGGTNELTLTATALAPSTDSGQDLGTSSSQFADLFLDGGNINLDNATDIDIDDNLTGSLTISEAANEYLSFHTLNTQAITVFNETTADIDFRIESDNNANMLLLDASSDAFGLGSSISNNSTMFWFNTGGRTFTTHPSSNAGFVNFSGNLTDGATAASGTATTLRYINIAQSTFAASNTGVTTTNAATLRIAGAPVAGTNMTLTNVFALWVDAGKVRFDGGGTSAQASAAGGVLEIQASTVNGNNASSTIAIGSAMSLGVTTFTNDTATLTMTNAASFYIAGIPVASTNVAFTNTALALWVDAGTARFDGDVIVGGSTSTTETIAAAGFSLGGDDLFVAGLAGVEGTIYTDTAVDVASTVLDVNSLDFVGAGAITTVGALTLDPSTGIAFTLTDNQTDALDIQEGTNNYININTTNTSENVAFGNATTNPSFSFLGTGAVTIAGSADGTDALTLTLGDILVSNGDVDISGGDFNVTLDDQDVFNLVGTAASSVAGNGAAAANIFTITGPAGQASTGVTGQTGGAGAASSLTAGVGGAVAGAGGIGGAGGALTFAAGAGGAGAATGGAGGAVSITAGAAGTGGNAAGGTLTLNSGAVTGSGASTLNLGTADTTIINLGDSTVTKTIDIGGVTSSDATTLNIATEGTAADVLTIGNTNASTTIALTGGDDWSMAATGILTMSASATQTTAIVITDTDYTNALNIGDNTITGTTANIDLTYFDVAGATGAVTIDPQTTGTYLDFTLETAWTSGTLINADFAATTTQATSAMIGLQFDLDTNLTGANGLGITGTNIIMNALTQTSADTATYTVYGNSASGALTQNTLAGTINWRGANITLPIITQTTGTVTADGLRVLVPASGAIVTGGTMSGVNIVAPTTSGPAAGTLYGVQIGALTSAGAATETAISIGSGWDTDINATTSLEIGIGGANELTLTATALAPSTDSGQDLGTSSSQFADLFLDGGNINLDNATDIDIDDNLTGALTISEAANEYLSFHTLNTQAITVFNETTADIDFRIESDNNANMLLLDASSDAFGLGSSISNNSTMFWFNTGGRTFTTHPSSNAGFVNLSGNLTDGATAASGIATTLRYINIAQPTFAASNTGVTTTNAATLRIAGAPVAGTNMTLANAYALWVDAGDVRIDGNVGIGITSGVPSATLHVVGQCVTGDTRLRRRRRRRGAWSNDEELGTWNLELSNRPPSSNDQVLSSATEEYIYDEVMIKDIQPGDEIASLDEQTGKIVYRRVNALMNMGVRSIYKLTTEDGRSIRTTGNHPYLVRNQQTVSSLVFAFADETGIAAHTDTQPYFGVGILATKEMSILNKKLHDILVRALSAYKITKDKFEFKFNHIHHTNVTFYKEILKVLQEHDVDWEFAAIQEDKQGKHWTQTQLWENYLAKVKNLLAEYSTQELVLLADYLSKPNLAREDFDVLLGEKSVRGVLQLESQGSLLIQVADILLGSLSFTLRKGRNLVRKEIAEQVLQLLKDKKMRVTELGSSPSSTKYITGQTNLSSTATGKGKWTKVMHLKVGMEIGVRDGKTETLSWMKIAKIEQLPLEQVYDIEVEGTHNFIGNDIVAHNTYINSSTDTGIGLDIDANSLTTGYGLDISSTSTAGTGSSNSRLLNLARSGANANASHTAYGLYSSVTNTGTTSTNVGGYFTASGATNNYAAVFDAGYVGIGDTTPDVLLDILSATTGSDIILTNTNATDTDVRLGLALVDGTNNFTLGVDDSDNDTFKIGTTALETSTTLTIDSRTTTSGVSAITLAGIAPTIASAAGAEYTTLTLTPPTITLTGTTQVTSQMDSVLINAPTVTGDTATLTIDDAATLTIAGPPIESTNVALTDAYGLMINQGAATAATRAYGLYVNAPTGAGTNYAASFAGGNVGIGTATPTNALEIQSAGVPLRIHNTTDAASNQVFVMRGANRATPADGDTTYMSFAMPDDAQTEREILRISAEFTDVSTNTKNSSLFMSLWNGNSFNSFFEIDLNTDNTGETVFNEAAYDVDFRVESDTNTNALLLDSGTFGGVGQLSIGAAVQATATAFAVIDNPALTVTSNQNFYKLLLDNTNAATVSGATTSAIVASLAVDEPNITATGTVTTGSTVYISDAPTEGSANYSLWVDAGTSRFDGGILIPPEATGTFLDFALETEWTSGTLINADFAGATTQATSAMTGLQFDLDANLTGANGLGITGTNIIMNALTQTSADTATYTVYGNSASGDITQNTLAGTINWRGANITLPIITQTTGTITADGLRVLVPASGAIVTGGTMSGVNIVAPTTSGPAAGTLYGLNIGALTSAGGATETAINVGTGWDMVIGMPDDGLIGLGTAAGRIEFDDQATDEVNILSAYLNVGITSNVVHAGVNSKLQVATATSTERTAALDYYAADANSSHLMIGKSRGATVGTLAYPLSGDQLGEIDFMGAGLSNSRFEVGASMIATAGSTWDASNRETYMTFSTVASGATGVSERIRIASSGNVGINDASPDALFDIDGSAVSGGDEMVLWTPGAHTAVIAEVIDISVAAHTNTITGAYTTQRFTNLAQPIISAASALTVTTAATQAIAGTPNPTGTGAATATITNSFGLMLGTALATVPAYSALNATTIDNAAMLYIAGAPATGGNVTVTNGYALWVDAGTARFDGDVIVGGSTSATETIAAAGFSLGGDDLFVAGLAGVEGTIYTDTALDVASTVLDINSLDFTGAGLLTTGATLNLTFTPGTTGDLLFSTDADTVATFAGSADGTANVTLTAGDLTLTDGDLIISGGDFNVTLDDQDVFNLVGTAASSVAGNGAAAANIFTITGPAGQASTGVTGQTGGAGAASSLTGGAGGAVAGASGIGGAGGALTFAAGAGGAGAATGGAGGAISITAGAAGTGGNAAGGTLTLNSGAVTGTGTSTINLGTADTTVINIGDSTVTKTIDIGGVTSSDATTLNIATEGTAADVLTIGNTNASTTIAITGGDDWSMAATGILTMSASAGQTTAIVITDTDYTNSLSIGDNTITGTTANIDLTYFDVTGATGAVTIDPQTTGTYIDFTLETAWTSGTLINADFALATTQSGGDITGLSLNLNSNLTGAADLDVTGVNAQTPLLSPSSGATTTTYIAYNNSASGALTTSGTFTGTLNWRGVNLTMPNITQISGSTVNATGVLITNGTITTGGTQSMFSASMAAVGAGTLNGVLITPPGTTTSGGTINGINLGSITTSNGTDTAITIGTGWDMVIGMPDDGLIGLGTAAGRIEFDDQATDEVNILNANVGIGTATPGLPLHIQRPTGATYQGAFSTLLIDSSSEGYPGITFADNGTSVSLIRNSDASDNDLTFWRNSGTGASPLWVEVMTFDRSSGNVGIGDTTPDALFDIDGTAVSGGDEMVLWTPGAHTAVTAEVIDISVAAHTNIITGAYTTQRFTNFAQPIISAATALTVTTAATQAIAGTPNPTGAGPATITNSFGLMLGTALATVPAYSALNATTITNAAMLYVAGAPATGGNVTVTNGYALWVDGGTARFDGNIQIGGASDSLVLTYSDITGAGWSEAIFQAVNGNDAARVTIFPSGTSNTTSFQLANDNSTTNFDTLQLRVDDGVAQIGRNPFGTPPTNITSLVINEDGFPLDFRIESDTNANAFILDASGFGGVGDLGIGGAAAGAAYVSIDHPALTAASNTNFIKLSIDNTAAVSISDGTTSALVASLAVDEPNITLVGTGAVTAAATVYIQAAPTEGSLNYSLFVDGGVSRFDGSVTIGSTAPSEEFDVEGQIQLDLDGTTDTTIGVCKDVADAGGVENDVEFTDCSSTPGDIAEWYETEDGVEAGDVLVTTNAIFEYEEKEYDPKTGLQNGKVSQHRIPILKKSSTPYETKVIGIVSTSPYQVFGEAVLEAGAKNPQPVALSGRVLVKVSLENGPIQTGDLITSSSTPGVGMKATEAGVVVGMALEAFDGNTSEVCRRRNTTSEVEEEIPCSKVMVFVNPHWQPGSLLAQSDFQLDTDPLFKDLSDKVSLLETRINELALSASTSALLSVILGSEATPESRTDSGQARMTIEDIDVKTATVSGSLMVLGRTTVTDLGVTGDISAGLLSINGLINDTSEVCSDRNLTSEVGPCTGSTINTLSGNLYLQSEGLGGIDILAGKITIDTKGNVKISGDIHVSGNITSEGTVAAKEVQTEEFRVLGTKTIGTSTLLAGQKSIEVATPAATANSKIFLTPTTVTDKQLAVTYKSDGKFTVEIPEELKVDETPISFDWWIVN